MSASLFLFCLERNGPREFGSQSQELATRTQEFHPRAENWVPDVWSSVSILSLSQRSRETRLRTLKELLW